MNKDSNENLMNLVTKLAIETFEVFDTTPRNEISDRARLIKAGSHAVRTKILLDEHGRSD